MSDNVRFHSKHHGKAHHTTASPGYHDSAVDPIASSGSPFMGNFNLSGSHVYYDTSVAADTSITIGYSEFVNRYEKVFTTVKTNSGSWTATGNSKWTVASDNLYPQTISNNLGLGTTVADEKLTVSGNISASGGLSALGGINYFGGNVGIGTNAPSSNLHVALSDSTTNITSQFGKGIVVQNIDTTNNNFTSIQFKGGDSIMAQVGAQFVDHSNNAGELFFTTRDSSGSRTEKMRIDKDGNVFKGDFNEFANDIKFIDISINEKKIKGTEIGPIIYKKNFLDD